MCMEHRKIAFLKFSWAIDENNAILDSIYLYKMYVRFLCMAHAAITALNQFSI